MIPYSNRHFRFLFLCLTFFSLAWQPCFHFASAQVFPFRRAKAEEASLALTDKSGPWLIMVTSFSGEGGDQQASRLAKELRERHNLKAYTHAKHFKVDVESKGIGYSVVETSSSEPVTIPLSMRPANQTDFSEYAVLIGDYAAVDDVKAQRTLEKIKGLEPESIASLKIEDGFQEDELAGGRLQAWRVWSDIEGGRSIRPLRAAFMIANPLLPDEYFEARRIDKETLAFNTGLKYSLLDCPGTYSVKVATFKGSSTMDPEEMERISREEQRKMRLRQSITDSKLANALKKATLLTIELRRQGYEAYEFHDRFESYVCVGSFDWMMEKDSLGRERFNPEAEKVIRTFKGQNISNGVDLSQTRKTLSGKTFPLPAKFVEAGIVCDMQPLPVLIPKLDSTRFAARMLERFK